MPGKVWHHLEYEEKLRCKTATSIEVAYELVVKPYSVI
jgi:hypothetical protein